MRVVTREPGVDSQPLRESPARLESILVAGMIDTSDRWNHADLVAIGASRRP